MVTPATQFKTSQLSPNTRSPHLAKDAKSPSPSYFGFVVGEDSIPADSGPGPHARQNWNMPSDSSRSASRPVNNERNPEFELFRRQSEKNITFSLNNLPTNRASSTASSTANRLGDSPMSPTNTTLTKSKTEGTKDIKEGGGPVFASYENPFFAEVRRQESPAPMSPHHTISDHKNARLSLPAHEIQGSLETLRAQRSDTLPPAPPKESFAMAAPQEVAQAIEQYPKKTLVLDLRVFPQYSAARIRGALSLCIPTTLLKRPAFTVQKLAETFTTDEDKAAFAKWREAVYIVVYDATSSLPKEAITSFTVLKKFATEGFKGRGLVVKGGFQGFQKLVPRLIDSGNNASKGGSSTLSMSPPNHVKLPVAGGCEMPSTKNAANPFFSNIRQNMDLLDGVGQLPVKKPASMTEAEEKRLPTWLRRAASTSNEGKDVSNKFLNIEKTEQNRMQKALSCSVTYGTPKPERTTSDVQVAGIEKGSKNRYNNIFPYEHSRVKLQNVPSHGCDYVNASYVKAGYSKRRYIATQAPIPATFEDFWKVVWEQDARVLVMLTAESEGGQVKSHPYWKSGEYGQLKVRLLLEKTVSLSKSGTSKDKPPTRPSIGTRRSTTSSATPAMEKTFNFDTKATEPEPPKKEDDATVILRHLTISHSAYPFQPMREITQLQYTQWPDFGAPASPTAILNLIELVDKYQRGVTSPAVANTPSEPVNDGRKPIVVHCSAGCGRTGTFCTVDSVIDMLKRQRRERQTRSTKHPDAMDVDSEDDWIRRDDIDLVTKAVEDFRHQRLSMVQNLRQFVLCYESILQWLHEQSKSP